MHLPLIENVMNEALNTSSSNAFDAAFLSTLRRLRSDTVAANVDPRVTRLHATAGIVATALVSIRTALRRALASYRAYRNARETLWALRGLDDRTLHDLGYHRSEIESVAMEISIARAR
jgi:uncharacterized protein YjiS (DUF1127 family)